MTANVSNDGEPETARRRVRPDSQAASVLLRMSKAQRLLLHICAASAGLSMNQYVLELVCQDAVERGVPVDGAFAGMVRSEAEDPDPTGPGPSSRCPGG